MLKILSCGRNCESYIKYHMESIKNQTYHDFTHFIVNDASTDNTQSEIQRNLYNQCVVSTNTTRKYWIQSVLDAVTFEPDDIYLIVDLDDWLPHSKVLEAVVSAYSNSSCWMTYSRMLYVSSGRTSHWIPSYSQKQLNERLFRHSIWSYTHLRTFKGFLWDKIDKDHLKDCTGNYAKYAWDRYVFYPMLDMSAPSHITFIPDILYCYNDSNPNQVEKTQRKVQEMSALYASNHIPRYPSL